MMSEIEYVTLVDNRDNILGYEEKLAAHQQGKLHRAFSVFIFRYNTGEIELLLQQRQHDKYHCANLWSNTCCSHPRPNEDIIAAGQRRLKEEMGIDVPLQHAGSFTYRAELSNGLIEHEYDHVLIGEYNDDPVLNPQEVADYCWMPAHKLTEGLIPADFQLTPWFQQALTIALNHIKK